MLFTMRNWGGSAALICRPSLWNPPAEVRVASGKNFCPKIISYIVLQTSVESLKYLLKRILTTPRRLSKTKFEVYWKYWWNEANDVISPKVAQFHWAFNIFFSYMPILYLNTIKFTAQDLWGRHATYVIHYHICAEGLVTMPFNNLGLISLGIRSISGINSHRSTSLGHIYCMKQFQFTWPPIGTFCTLSYKQKKKFLIYTPY